MPPLPTKNNRGLIPFAPPKYPQLNAQPSIKKPVQPITKPVTPFYDPKVAQQSKYNQYEVQAAAARAAAREAASPLGMLRETIKGVGNTGKIFGNAVISSEKNFGNSIGDAIYAPWATKQVQKQQVQEQDNLTKILNLKKEKEARGESTQHLTPLIQSMATNRGLDVADIIPSVNKTNTQILGEAGGVALDVATAGTLSGAGKSFGLFTKANRAAHAAKEAQLLGKATNIARVGNVAKNIAVGGTVGYGQDVAYKAQEGITGPELYKPSLGTAIGAGIPALGGAVELGSEARRLYKGMTPAERQAGFANNPFAAENKKETDSAYKLMRDLKSDDFTHNGKVNLDAMEGADDFMNKYKSKKLTQDDVRKAQELHYLLKGARDTNVVPDLDKTLNTRKLEVQLSAQEAVSKGETDLSTKTPEKLKGHAKAPVEAFGAFGGIEPERDDNGQITGFKVDPTKAALGFAGMAAFQHGKKFYTKGELTMLKTELDIAKETLANHPAKSLSKYANKFGEIGEVVGEGGKFAKSGDNIVTELGFSDSETARNAYQDYLKGKKLVGDMETVYKETKAKSNPAKAELEKLKGVHDRKVANEFVDQQTAGRKATVLNSNEVPFETPKAPVKFDGVPTPPTQDRTLYDRLNNLHKEPNQKDSMFAKLKQALAPLKYQDPETQTLFKDWNRKIVTGKVLVNEELSKIKVPNEQGMEVIHAYQKGVPTPHSTEIKNTFDALYQDEKKQGFDVSYRKNYIPQVWDDKPEEMMNAMAAYMKDSGVEDAAISRYLSGAGSLPDDIVKRLKLDPSFIKERAFPDYATGIKYGLTPKFTNPAQLAAYTKDQLEKTVANRNLIDGLVQKGKILTQDMAPKHWQAVELPFSSKGYYAQPRLAKMLNGVFRDEGNLGFGATLAKGIANVSKTAQEIALSAGIPHSNVNFFSIGQTIKQLTAGDFKAPLSFIRANFNEASAKFFEKNQPYLKMMAQEGIDLGSHIGSYESVYKNTLENKGLWDKAKIGFDNAFNKKTFSSFMPQLYTQTFKDAFESATTKGMKTDEARKLAAEVTRNMFGMVENMGRGKTTSNVISSLFFAPKFRSTIIRTLMNTAKSVTTQTRNPAFRNNRKLFAGMVVTYAMYDALNYKLNGNHIFQNESGKEFAVKIPYGEGKFAYIEFMPSFLSFARNMVGGGIATVKGDMSTAKQKFGSLMSMPLKTGSELWANKDYFDNPIYKETDSGLAKTGKMAGYALNSVNHPFPKEIISYMQGKKTAGQAIIAGAELPMKFSNKEKIIASEAYDVLDKQKENNARFKTQAEKRLKTLENSSDAAVEFDQLIKEDPQLAKKVIELKKEQDLGYTPKDNVISRLGVENKERAKFLVGQFNKLETDEEKAKLWDEMVTKKLITKDVSEQMAELLKH